MAHVLVADGDDGIREAIQMALEYEGHDVLTAANGTLALGALWASRRPLVVLVNERLSDIGGLAILRMAAEDRIGLLARHSYALMSTHPHGLSITERNSLTQRGIPILPQPFELDDLLKTALRLDRRLRLVHHVAALRDQASHNDAPTVAMIRPAHNWQGARLEEVAGVRA
jgi:DNA-binding NtrC family response regulator